MRMMSAVDQSKVVPTLQMSTDCDPMIAARKNKQYKMKYNTENATKLTFAQMEGKCYCCEKGGQCRYKSRPKEEWAINNAKAEEVVSS